MQTNFKEKQGKRKDKNFTEETKELFRNNFECWQCGMNTWDCFHHCMGGDFDEADSPFNAVPLCNATCHIDGGHHFSEKQINTFLAMTMRYLYLKGYELTRKDKMFIIKFKKRYESTELGSEYLKYYRKRQ